MQFVLVIHHGTFPLPGTPKAETITEEERKDVYAGWAAINKMDNVQGGPPLSLPQNAMTVRVQNGETITAEGTYQGTTVGGFLLVEAEDLDAAIAIASSVPQARLGGAVEVRPSEKYW
ncbi:YciI family protein [Kibdelosporangium philippinense]|uniref:YciI family protein n=1 Tax=Kibdelosporangium philippinense TaxID=211113 RepID=A0ABS8ZDQ1_9PSEU|nr:YciI family protein [Kibdelosporangium philippinense]MCE7005364.1 YciI family protein [Kibdelosporangium philippinense]